MTVIAVLVRQPNGTLTAHVVDTTLTVAEVTAEVVAALGLPAQLHFELLSASGENALPAESTLDICGVKAGAELRLRAVRDRILKLHLDQLYAEAERYIRGQQWQQAEEVVADLLAYDSSYPDPLGLEAAIDDRSQPAKSALRPSFPRRKTNSRPQAIFDEGDHRASHYTKLTADPTRKYILASNIQQNRRWNGLGRVGCIVVVVLLFVASVGGGVLLFSPALWPTVVQMLNLDQTIAPARFPGGGDVQVTLHWTGPADLDLRVASPEGDEVRFDTPRSATGGILDMEANGDCFQESANPVENIYWPDGAAPSGTYHVTVAYFHGCGSSGVTNYVVTVKRNRETLEVISGQIAEEDGEQLVVEFSFEPE